MGETVDKSGMNQKTTADGAMRKAQAFVHALKGAAPDRSVIQFTKLWNIASEAFGVVTQGLKPPTRDEFMFDVGAAFGGTMAFLEMFGDEKDLVDRLEFMALTLGQIDAEAFAVNSAGALSSVHWINALVNQGWELWTPQNGTIVVPLTDIWVDSGVLHTYSCLVYKEDSTGSGQEKYVDVYVSAEMGLKVPIVQNILTFDVKTGTKVGEKAYTKRETKDATRIGTQVSRSFLVQKVGRDCLILSPRHFVAPNGLPAWEYLSVQLGYQIVPKEGGDTLGPFWPWYNLDGSTIGGDVGDMAYRQAKSQLDKLLVDTARDIALRS